MIDIDGWWFQPIIHLGMMKPLLSIIYGEYIYIYIYTSGWWLSHTPEKSEDSSVGMIPFPTEWDNNPSVPNHQPE